MHPQVPRQLVSFIVRVLSVIFQRSWGLVVAAEDRKKRNVTSVFKKGKSKVDKLVHLTPVQSLQSSLHPRKVME